MDSNPIRRSSSGDKGGGLMADRVTKINVQVEYENVHKDRLSKIVAMAEYVEKPEPEVILGNPSYYYAQQ